MSSWHSYPKIYNLGHYVLKQLLEDSVTVEEKIDGSQFSFGIFAGELRCRSKGKQLELDNPEKMFLSAVDTARRLQPLLIDGYTYRGEFLRTPAHNTLEYERIPNSNVIIFDICTAEETYMNYADKLAEATRLGLETVPLLFEGRITEASEVFALMNRTSVLGKAKIEGLVIKNYFKFGPDKKALLGKHVSEEFKEVHQGEWARKNPTNHDILALTAGDFKTEARWNKAVQHLAEKGLLTNTPKDIGNLMKEVQQDIEAECEAEIKARLYKWALPHILRGVIKGIPDWYKSQLVAKQFEEPKDEN